MAQIVEFRKKTANRYKALAKGNIKTFICDECHIEFEVINDDYPYRCPGCDRIFNQFKHLEENI